MAKKQVFNVETIKGQSIELTENTQIMTEGGYINPSDLTENHHLEVSINRENSFKLNKEEFNEGYLIGCFISDGSFVKTDNIDNIARFQLLKKDKGTEGIKNFIEEFFPEEKDNRLKFHLNKTKEIFKNWWMFSSSDFTSICKKYNLTPEEKVINEEVENQSLSFISGVVSSFFDIRSIFLKSRDVYIVEHLEKRNIFALQRMLLKLGVKSDIDLIEKRVRKSNFAIKDRTNTWRLSLSSALDTRNFLNKTSLKHLSKIKKEVEIKSNSNSNNFYKVKTITISLTEKRKGKVLDNGFIIKD